MSKKNVFSASFHSTHNFLSPQTEKEDSAIEKKTCMINEAEKNSSYASTIGPPHRLWWCKRASGGRLIKDLCRLTPWQSSTPCAASDRHDTFSFSGGARLCLSPFRNTSLFSGERSLFSRKCSSSDTIAGRKCCPPPLDEATWTPLISRMRRQTPATCIC